MRSAGVVVLALAVAALAIGAEDKPAPIDQAKLVGTWEAVKGGPPPGSTVAFTKDGNVTSSILRDGKKEVHPGTYTIKEGVLDMAFKDGPKMKLTVKVLSDDKLLVHDALDGEVEFKRKK
jgi:uncharacterized protein (TIGR03066 family)